MSEHGVFSTDELGFGDQHTTCGIKNFFSINGKYHLHIFLDIELPVKNISGVPGSISQIVITPRWAVNNTPDYELWNCTVSGLNPVDWKSWESGPYELLCRGFFKYQR